MKTNEERFEAWWDSKSRPGWRWGSESLAFAERLARAAFNAALSDEDAETCAAALEFVEEHGPSMAGREHCAAVRRRLEVIHADEH